MAMGRTAVALERIRRSLASAWAHALAGALAGMLLLHPVTKAVYGPQWRDARSELDRLGLAFTPEMLPMTGAFALLGGAVGLLFSLYHRLLIRHQRARGLLEAELERGVPSLIADGESEHVEFKAAARWDIERGCVSRAIEDAVTRAIAGFLNHAGGSLLIGVTDNGDICGIDADRRTLRDADRDGYERFIIGLVRTRIGGEACPLVHVTFHTCDGRDVCRVIVEASRSPMYIHDGAMSRLFVRLGNSTRELDVREAMEYVSYRFSRWPKNRQPFGLPA